MKNMQLKIMVIVAYEEVYILTGGQTFHEII